MNLADLNYLEPVFENKGIVGGISTSTSTDSTYSAALANTTPDGNVAVVGLAFASGGAIGDISLVSALTNTSTSAGIFNVAIANASAGAIAFGPSSYNASNSIANSLTVSNLYGYNTTEFASSVSLGK